MLVKKPKYRKAIGQNQAVLLDILFRFRFASVPILSEYLEKDKSTIYERLLALLEQGYIQKSYDSSYRLRLRPATYSLAAKGIAYLRNNNPDGYYSETALRNMYKNKSATDSLVDHSLLLAKLYIQLKKQYPSSFYIQTVSEMTSRDDLLRPLPNLCLQKADENHTTSNYFLETIEAGTFRWILRKRIMAHQNFRDEHEDIWGSYYPSLLFVCENTSTERRIHRLVYEWYLDFEVWTTTQERLAAAETAIWLRNYDPGWDKNMELIDLHSIT